MRFAGLKWFIGFCVSLIAAGQAYAQPQTPYTVSIESTVANSDYVSIATIVKFRCEEQGNDPDKHDATIGIEEELKYPLSSNERSQIGRITIIRPASVLAGWQERSSRLLIATREFAPELTVVIELLPDKLEVMTADVKLLRDPEAVIQAARVAVTRLPANIKRVHTFDLQVPREVVAGTNWEQCYNEGSYLRMNVPVDQHLEKRAQDYVRSENPHQRAEGAKALAYFKSDENIAFVRPLLNDPGVTYLQPAYEGKAGERLFGVRHSAYETLKAWGIDVKQPVFREEVPYED